MRETERELVFEISKKLIKYVILAKVATSCIKLVKSIKRMTPKFDKFEGIDPDVLIENLTKEEALDLSLPENLPTLP